MRRETIQQTLKELLGRASTKPSWTRPTSVSSSSNSSSSSITESGLVELLSSFECFHSNENRHVIFEQIADSAECRFVSKNTFLFHKYQYADYFYVLLEGSAIKLVEKNPESLKQEYNLNAELRSVIQQQFAPGISFLLKETLRRQESTLRQTIESMGHHKSTDKAIQDGCDIHFKSNYFDFQKNEHVCKYSFAYQYNEGDLIGEIQLYDSKADQKRQCSVLVTEDSKFCCIPLTAVREALASQLESRTPLCQYLRSIGCEIKTLASQKQFNQFFEFKQYKKDAVVYKQNSFNDGSLYYIVKGGFEFQVLDNSSTEQNPNCQLFSPKIPSSPPQTKPVVKILQVSQDDIFGYEEAYENQQQNTSAKKKREFSVVCVHPSSQVFKIKKEFFDNPLFCATLQILIERGVKRYSRLQSIQAIRKNVSPKTAALNEKLSVKPYLRRYSTKNTENQQSSPIEILNILAGKPPNSPSINSIKLTPIKSPKPLEKPTISSQSINIFQQLSPLLSHPTTNFKQETVQHEQPTINLYHPVSPQVQPTTIFSTRFPLSTNPSTTRFPSSPVLNSSQINSFQDNQKNISSLPQIILPKMNQNVSAQKLQVPQNNYITNRIMSLNEIEDDSFDQTMTTSAASGAISKEKPKNIMQTVQSMHLSSSIMQSIMFTNQRKNKRQSLELEQQKQLKDEKSAGRRSYVLSVSRSHSPVPTERNNVSFINLPNDEQEQPQQQEQQVLKNPPVNGLIIKTLEKHGNLDRKDFMISKARKNLLKFNTDKPYVCNIQLRSQSLCHHLKIHSGN